VPSAVSIKMVMAEVDDFESVTLAKAVVSEFPSKTLKSEH